MRNINFLTSFLPRFVYSLFPWYHQIQQFILSKRLRSRWVQFLQLAPSFRTTLQHILQQLVLFLNGILQYDTLYVRLSRNTQWECLGALWAVHHSPLYELINGRSSLFFLLWVLNLDILLSYHSLRRLRKWNELDCCIIILFYAYWLFIQDLM